MYVYILFFTTIFGLTHAYNTTHELFMQVEKLCLDHVEYTCKYHDEILVVDWKIHKGRHLVWNFNEHARELITGELALHMLYKLPEINPDKRITIIPVLNVWGRTRAFKNHCQRKNKNGVDINRNFWTTNHHRYKKHSEEYEGLTPISEKESKLLASILKDNTKRYINVHSGEFSLYIPYDGAFKHPPQYDKMMENVKTWSKYCKECTVGPAAIKSLYRAYGTSVDWAVENGIPEAYTFEIFGEDTWNCKSMFNPKDPAPILQKWEKILKLTINI